MLPPEIIAKQGSAGVDALLGFLFGDQFLGIVFIKSH
jgi:hypothetical protein